MKLSIIIVNYNVKHFLEQCLISVLKSAANISTEIFVVDNNSVDGSCSMIREKFPHVILIENKKNYGFSVANNQAIKIATGQYILLLNPDTVVDENSFEKCIQFMDTHENAGGLSVKMIDGKGRFLPESKRALPTPIVAFYKIFGLSRLFPKSKIFARYHLGHLPHNEINEIEILPGAYMFMRKSHIDKVGMLDEDYFMYGEDIDLSYRITQAGYKNYYYPETTIIHYKGESTKKGSLNYVFVFYMAMIIFARKHFSKKNAKLYSILINTAIYFRAFVALLNRIIKQAALPALDISGIFLSYVFIKPIWEQFKFKGYGQYPDEFLAYSVPAYIFIWVLCLLIYKAYTKQLKTINVFKGISLGTIIILALYSLLPEELRFSRALILIGAFFFLLIGLINRLIIHIIHFFPHQFVIVKKHKIVIVGRSDEVDRITSIMNNTDLKPDFVGIVTPDNKTTDINHLGNLSQLSEIIKIHKIDEIIFCAKNISSNQIINKMLQLSVFDIEFKIAQPETLSIIGSNSIETAGELYMVEMNAISKEKNKQNKRAFDIIISLIILILSPFLVSFSKISLNVINNSLNVLLGFKSWVGYFKEGSFDHLPKIKNGILSPLDLVSKKEYSESFIQNANTVYAKNYTIWNDLKILLKGFKRIDRKTV